uniref:Uncharacterized protein n=1 Tax=Opuntia streptacantha TaxID=393608 RepID=A0A7C8ZA73_OPUST
MTDSAGDLITQVGSVGQMIRLIKRTKTNTRKLKNWVQSLLSQASQINQTAVEALLNSLCWNCNVLGAQLHGQDRGRFISESTNLGDYAYALDVVEFFEELLLISVYAFLPILNHSYG